MLSKLGHLEEWNSQRQKNAAQFNEAFANCEQINTPIVSKDNVCIYHQYVIRVSNRDGVAEYLQAHGIGCRVYYPVPLHVQECFTRLGYKQGDFPEAERAAKEVLALPIYPELSPAQKDLVIHQVLKAVGG